jgi:hypothetical protein
VQHPPSSIVGATRLLALQNQNPDYLMHGKPGQEYEVAIVVFEAMQATNACQTAQKL